MFLIKIYPYVCIVGSRKPANIKNINQIIRKCRLTFFWSFFIPKIMITASDVTRAEQTGQYQFPFVKGSFIGNAIMDESVTFQDYISIEENWFAQLHLGKRHKYTSIQMESNWNCTLIQRKTLLAALMVADGKIIGINQGLRMFNIL